MGGESRHSRAFQFRSSAIRPLLKEGLKSWELTSGSNKYTIEEIIENKIHKCSRKCRTCKVCFHMYSCTCPDYGKGSTICKHIHACILNMDNKLDTAVRYSPPEPYGNYHSHYYDDEDEDENYEDWHHGMFSMITDPAAATSVRHDRALEFDPLTINATHTEVSLESWNVTSARDVSTTYAVREVTKSCEEYEECRSKCSPCNACQHMFTCTCPDYDNDFMCKHIHACIIFFKIGSRCENTTENDQNTDLIELLNNCKCLMSKTIYKNDTILKLKKGLQKILQMAAKPDYLQRADSKNNIIPIDSKENLKPANVEANSIANDLDVDKITSLKRENVSEDEALAPKQVKHGNEISPNEPINSLPCMIVKTESTD